MDNRRSTWFPQHGIRSSNLQLFASNAPRRIRQDLQQVVRELVPLNNSARPADNSSSSQPISSWLRQQSYGARNNNEAASPPPDSAPSPPLPQQQPNSNNNFVIDIEMAYPLEPSAQMREESPPVHPGPSSFHDHPPTPSQILNASLNSDTGSDNSANNNNNNHNLSDGNQANGNSPELQALVNLFEKYIPIVLILFLKLMFDHSIGISIVAGLIITFWHSNSIVKSEVAKQAMLHNSNGSDQRMNARQLGSLLLLFLNLTICLCFVYFVLTENNLAFALIFIPPYDDVISFLDVLWIVTVTDLNLKLITIIFKTVVLLLPAPIMAFQKKGKHYLFLESTSQLYRTLAPMQHWLYFFSESYNGPSKIFGVILSATYLISKGKDIMNKTKGWRKAFGGLLEHTSYGVKPSAEQLKTAGGVCPICQDDFKLPTMLHCKHIFCEECVSVWFDRERTCPMCRAEIADDPSWKDGSTSFLIQVM